VIDMQLFNGLHADTMEKGATISPCGLYRYSLWRKWKQGPMCVFVGLNPSTADATLDDPTIRRCIGFAKSWGFSGLMMLNLFAYRATDPGDMKAAADPVGPDNDDALHFASTNTTTVIAAWGAHGMFKGRDKQVRAMLPRLHYLRLTKDGHPGHPLYLPASLRPVEWLSPSTQ
jgi:hypothetical protein